MTASSGSSPNTVLFVDVVGSTGLYENLGDATAHAHIQEAFYRIRAIVLGARGIVIKSIGDELMCCFASAPDAVRAACDIQTGFRSATGPLPRLSFRIGLHSGDGIWKDNDLFGDSVNVAARLVAMAKAEQIVTSTDTLSLCQNLPPGSARKIGTVGVKGRRQQVECMEVIWKDEKELTTWIGGLEPEAAPGRMNLVFGTVSLVIDDSQPSATVGRDSNNSIVARSPRVSSSHAVIERRGDKFFLRDQSTNGCLVLTTDRPQIKLLREEVALQGEGVIVLGGAPSDPDRTIHFRIVH